jgi:hypothetical protein
MFAESTDDRYEDGPVWFPKHDSRLSFKVPNLVDFAFIYSAGYVVFYLILFLIKRIVAFIL